MNLKCGYQRWTDVCHMSVEVMQGGTQTSAACKTVRGAAHCAPPFISQVTGEAKEVKHDQTVIGLSVRTIQGKISGL